ncbi:hypothetical protein FHT76_006679 [Rhizobium sp. BK176]|nr:hypothetical protein [Rhizobium sp. BK399]MCS3743057.1 hypothetical protein [Rhizobium sp. BK661]MCS4094970.1 hypothetical protein [Rhizobium sp. BK176]
MGLELSPPIGDDEPPIGEFPLSGELVDELPDDVDEDD